MDATKTGGLTPGAAGTHLPGDGSTMPCDCSTLAVGTSKGVGGPGHGAEKAAPGGCGSSGTASKSSSTK